MLYLASQSPRRREILDQIGVSYQVIPQDIDETALPQESPENYVKRMALEKARAGLVSISNRANVIPSDNSLEGSQADKCELNTINHDCVLGADTIVVLGGQILGKPIDRESYIEMMIALSGRKHLVMSAVAIVGAEDINDEKSCVELSTTEVFFCPLDRKLIERYWDTKEPCDKAGGYGIQGFGAIFVEKIIGSYTGVVGLPIGVLFPLLNKFNVPFWNGVTANKSQGFEQKKYE